MNKRILIASPIYQKPVILTEFLYSLQQLDDTGLELDYYFTDDNEDENSSTLLQQFAIKNKGVYIEKSSKIPSRYICDERSHYWNNALINKVAHFKNRMLAYALEKGYDYIFLVDSDLLLQPFSLQQLIRDEKEIVSIIFWTQWQEHTIEMPQVWLKDVYTLYDDQGENLSEERKREEMNKFFAMLRMPGVYRVGGLGACTLISHEALKKGVNFDPIYNISFWGEDRAFCIRAVALGLELFVDTHYPAYHIYRESLLPGAQIFKDTYYSEVKNL